MNMLRIFIAAILTKAITGEDDKLPDIGENFSHLYDDYDPYYEHDGGIFGSDEDMFSRDWIEHVINFELNESEFFYEDVTDIGTVLKGGFFASGGQKGGVKFQILNPDMVEVYNSQGKPDVFFSVKTEMTGTYTFHFSAPKKQQVSFIIGTGKKGALKKEQVQSMEEKVKTVDRVLRDIQNEGSYLWSRQKNHLKTVDEINSRVLWFTVVEFLVLIAVAGFQVFYVKNLLSYRRLY